VDSREWMDWVQVGWMEVPIPHSSIAERMRVQRERIDMRFSLGKVILFSGGEKEGVFEFPVTFSSLSMEGSDSMFQLNSVFKYS